MIEVNGEARAFGGSLAVLAETMELPAGGVAVAVNGEVVRRADWPGVELRDGDRVEILTATQGG